MIPFLDLKGPYLELKQELDEAMSGGTSLNFSEAHVNVDNIKMRVFEKKIN